MADVVLPDEKDLSLRASIKRVMRRIDKIKKKTQDEKYDELWYYLRQYNGWVKALKPYLEARIEAYKTLAEAKFDGTETMEEIGVRFTLGSLVINELQAIIDKVEVTSQVVAERKKKEKERKKKERR